MANRRFPLTIRPRPADKKMGGRAMTITPLTITGLSSFSDDFQTILNRAVSIASLPLSELQNDSRSGRQKHCSTTSAPSPRWAQPSGATPSAFRAVSASVSTPTGSE
jgi:hypothetical protein